MFHGSVVDMGNGNYTVSAWPVVAGAYQMSVLVSALEPSRWALGYRQDLSNEKLQEKFRAFLFVESATTHVARDCHE